MRYCTQISRGRRRPRTALGPLARPVSASKYHLCPLLGVSDSPRGCFVRSRCLPTTSALCVSTWSRRSSAGVASRGWLERRCSACVPRALESCSCWWDAIRGEESGQWSNLDSEGAKDWSKIANPLSSCCLKVSYKIVAIYTLLQSSKGHLGPRDVLLRVLELIVGQ